MNELEVQKVTSCNSFGNMNGEIMRFLNIVQPSERTVNSIYLLFKDSYETEEMRRGLEYLVESEYISIGHAKGAACIDELRRGSFGKIPVRLTARGMRVLYGTVSDDCVLV